MKVPDAELEVLKTLWKRGPSTIRQLTRHIYPEGGTSSYATVQKLLERLMAKGCVARSREGRRHLYSASIERSTLIESRLQETADRLCEGSMTPLLTQLVTSSRLSPDEVASVRALIRRLEDGEEERNR